MTPFPLANPGVFADETLQALYAELIGLGDTGLAQAQCVGFAIEEKDLVDLEVAIEETAKRDIERVYANLRHGSENHLRAFTPALARMGIDAEEVCAAM